MFNRTILFSTFCVMGFVASANDNLDELMSMSLEELSMLDVTMETASKFTQKLSDVPASVYVLTNERIIRSGATTIAEAIALVPGMYVSKWNENSYYVSSRGFHDGLYNKMLVMVDGRSVYSPIYGGVYWSTLDYILADIDRIEVLRGPSGAIWGGNAANGVVNIITKSPQETQGTYLSGTVGRYNAYDFSIRQGVQYNETINARAFYKSRSNPAYLSSEADQWTTDTGGVEFERKNTNSSWQLRIGGSKLSHDLDVYTTTYDRDDPYNTPVTLGSYQQKNDSISAYVQFNHQIELESGDQVSSSLWFDHVKDESLDAPGEYSTVDLEVNIISELSDQHRVIYGAGYRHIGLRFKEHWQDVDLFHLSHYGRTYNIEDASDYIANGFVQSSYQWTDKVSTVFGVKAEYFEQNGSFELSPQARFLYDIDASHSIWTGIGRAVVAPSYMDSNSIYQQTYLEWYGVNSDIPYGSSYLTLPNDDLKNESVWTFEIGYRNLPTDKLELDATVFYSKHNNIRSGDCFDNLVLEGYEHLWFCFTSDDYSAQTVGAELASHYKFNDSLSLYGTYSYLTVDADWEKGEFSNGSNEEYISLPRQHLASLQLLWNISESLQWDFVARYNNTKYTDEMANETVGYDGTLLAEVEPHFTLDSRIGWQKNTHSPLVEVIVQKMMSEDIYDAWNLYPNEQLVYVRLSHEF